MIAVTTDTENLKIIANAGYIFSLAYWQKSQRANCQTASLLDQKP